MPTTTTKITAALVGATLILAACGGSGDSDRQRNAALVTASPVQRPVQAVDTFGDSAVMITSDGSVAVIGNPNNGLEEIATVTKGKKIVAVRSSLHLAGALDSDGVLYARGYYWERTMPRLPANATRWVDFDFDVNGMIAIADTGAIVQSTRGDTYPVPTLKPGASKFVRVEAGWFHYVVLDDMGNAYATGRNVEGQLNLPSLRDENARFVDISAKFYSTGLLDSEGNAYVVGWTPGTLAPPTLRDGGTEFTDIEVGTSHYSLLDDAGNAYHVSSKAGMPTSSRPSDGSAGFSTLAAGTDFTLALDDKGSLVVSSTGDTPYPVFIQRTPSLPIAASGNTTLVLGDDTALYQIGEPINEVLPSASGVISLGIGPTNVLTVNDVGVVSASGDNSFDQSTPPARDDFVKVVSGSTFSAGITATGRLVRWGLVPTGDRDGMMQSFSQNSIVDVVAGVDHITALTARGSAVSFGWLDKSAPNDVNQMYEMMRERRQPNMERIALIHHGFSAVAAHGRCSAAVSRREELSKPIVVWGECAEAISAGADLGDVRQLVIGSAHGAALRSDGTVVAWGDNSLGQTNVPADLKDVVHLAAGDNHTVAVDGAGRVWAWGDNSQRQTEIPENLRLSTREFASLVEARNLAAQRVTTPVPATVGDDIASLLGPVLPADAPAGASGAVIDEVVPPASKPVTTGLNVRTSRKITPTQGLKLLRIKGGKKPSFVVTKRSKSGPCTVTRTRLTTKKNGVCSATITYTTSKGKKATARLVVVITS